MKKFTDYASQENNAYNKGESLNSNESAFEFLKRVASKYEGASESDLISAILREAKVAKEQGRLSTEEIERFVSTISPMLSASQRKKLQGIITQINGD